MLHSIEKKNLQITHSIPIQTRKEHNLNYKKLLLQVPAQTQHLLCFPVHYKEALLTSLRLLKIKTFYLKENKRRMLSVVITNVDLICHRLSVYFNTVNTDKTYLTIQTEATLKVMLHHYIYVNSFQFSIRLNDLYH